MDNRDIVIKQMYQLIVDLVTRQTKLKHIGIFARVPEGGNNPKTFISITRGSDSNAVEDTIDFTIDLNKDEEE